MKRKDLKNLDKEDLTKCYELTSDLKGVEGDLSTGFVIIPMLLIIIVLVVLTLLQS